VWFVGAGVSLRLSPTLLFFRVRPVKTEIPGVFFEIPLVLANRLVLLGPVLVTESGDCLALDSDLAPRRDDLVSFRPFAVGA
jgi:hypothetical protein